MPSRQHRQQYPRGTVIGYGPDNKTATKLVACVFTKPGQTEPAAMERWFAQGGDLRQDPAIMAEVAAFMQRHHVEKSATFDRILGCPHEEGKDYPKDGVCPLCPFWASVDRHTHQPKSADIPLTANQILAGLRVKQDDHPRIAIEAADRNRDLVTEPFLEALRRGIADPKGTTSGEAFLFSYAMCFLAKWREPRAYPLIIEWLSLPGDGAYDIGGDTVTEWGPRVLASLCGCDLEPIKRLILNRNANEYCRAVAIESLAVLAAWGDKPREEVENYYLLLARQSLEREPSFVWNGFAGCCADIEAVAVFPELHRAYTECLIDPGVIGEQELDDTVNAVRGSQFANYASRKRRITDVAAETSWWAGFRRADSASPYPDALPEAYEEPGPYIPPQPYIAQPKTGRNEPCPCGSGKKYKKCCGK